MTTTRTPLPTPTQIRALLALRPTFDRDDLDLGEFDMECGMFESSDILAKLEKVANANGFTLPGFDWAAWRDAEPRVTSLPWIAQVDLETVCRLFTLHIRQDRFLGGHLAEMCREGVIQAMLARLAALADVRSLSRDRHDASD